MDLWIARRDDGYRGWVTVKDKNGNIRTGAIANDFTVTVVDPADTASTSPSVSESSTKSGLYYFDIPSSFLITNGIGQYGVVVELDTTVVGGSGSPKAIDTDSSVINVEAENLDSLAATLELVRFGGAVHIDTGSGTPGTAFDIGTEENPSSNLADALTIANNNGIRRFKIRGSVTLTSAFPDWEFVGNGEEAAVNINGQDVADSEFSNLVVSGSIGTGPVRLMSCELDGVGGFSGTAIGCSLLAGALDVTGNSRLLGCYSAVAGVATPAINFDAVAALSVEVRGYAGGIELRNMNNASDAASIDMTAGQVALAASCTAGTVAIRGVGNLTDNSAGTTVERNAFLNLTAIESAIWDATKASHVAGGSMGEAMLAAAGHAGLHALLDGGSGNADIVVNGNNNLTQSRLRVFATKAAHDAATAGAADGADGELLRLNIDSATYNAGNQQPNIEVLARLLRSSS